MKWPWQKEETVTAVVVSEPDHYTIQHIHGNKYAVTDKDGHTLKAYDLDGLWLESPDGKTITRATGSRAAAQEAKHQPRETHADGPQRWSDPDGNCYYCADGVCTPQNRGHNPTGRTCSKCHGNRTVFAGIFGTKPCPQCGGTGRG